MSAIPRRSLDQYLIWAGSLTVLVAVPGAVALHEAWLLAAAGAGWCVQHVGWAWRRRGMGGAA
ncbi:hypothetical protein M8Z33_19980 [Streptomyces sp. ZAF1911]|uniref:hypothetical protein n=1 Tax=Streptomyces sp. ZAF1911 TaxID=2944129 RepID=UPI00237A9DC1|nr:hypothetical protein [Streptomyces sp. ZAF1911]MDD9378897.1 hypothetical protein [Streptomyces sp. ZAF1911]